MGKKIRKSKKKEWENSFKFLKYTTSDAKLRWLQFRILHYILTTNRSVSKYNTNQDSRCTFCNAHSETIIHLLWKCNHVQIFWNNLAFKINKRCCHAHKLRFTEKLIIFGKCNVIISDKICDLIILLAKFYIYRCKVQNQTLNVNVFISEIYRRYIIEKVINRNSNTFNNSWAPYLTLFQGILS